MPKTSEQSVVARKTIVIDGREYPVTVCPPHQPRQRREDGDPCNARSRNEDVYRLTTREDLQEFFAQKAGLL